jgi:diguanylate cyclase (GGDEF)-like protein
MNNIPLTLDIGTFLFLMSLFSFLISGISFSSAYAMPSNIKGLKEWGYSMLCIGITFMLFFLREHIPSIYSLLGANIIILLTPLFWFIAYCKYFNLYISVNKLLVINIIVISALFFCYFSPHFRMYVIFVTASYLSFMCLVITRYISIYGETEKSLAAKINLLSFAFLAIVLLFRAFSVLSPITDKPHHSNMQFVFFTIASLTSITTFLGFIFMIHEKQRQAILESAKRDGLTGIYNRTAFLELADQIDCSLPLEIYSVLMVDIDFFKQINDNYGHSVGDLAIIHTTKFLHTHIQPKDLLGRYGGEEFCVLLRNKSEEEGYAIACQLVEKMRCNALKLKNGKEICFNISIGHVSRNCHKSDILNIRELLELADQALYKSKKTGRNKAISFIY